MTDGTGPEPVRGPGSGDHPIERASNLSRDAGITAALAAVFFLLRVLAVSHWDWHTAAIVAETVELGDAATILLGTVFAEPVFTGILIIVLAPIMIVTLIRPPRADRRMPVVTALFLAGTAAIGGSLAVSLGEWWIIIGTLLATAALAAARYLWQQGRMHRATAALLRSLGMVGLIGALIMAAGVSTPWVSLERIETDDGPVEGYVLETPSGYLKVLTDDPREAIILISSTIRSREVLKD